MISTVDTYLIISRRVSLAHWISWEVCKEKTQFDAIHAEEQSGYFSVQFPSISVSHWLHPEGIGPAALSDCVAEPQVGVQKPDPMPHNVVLHTKADVRAQLGTGVVRPRGRKTQLRVSEKAYSLWVPFTDALLLKVRTWKATEQGGGYDLTSKFLPLFPPAGNDCILLTDRPLSSKASSRGLAVTEWLLLPHLSLPWGPNPAYPLRSPLREAWILIKKHYGFLE